MQVLRGALLGAVVCLLSPGMAPAQPAKERETGWFFTGELSAVWTGGNQASNTVGVESSLRRAWRRSELRFGGGAVRTESSLTTRTAVGTPDDFELREQTATETTAESYYLRGRYDRELSRRVFLFGGVDWLRNTFAGVDSRFLVAGGVGTVWVDAQRVRFKTDYGVTATFQSDVVENPFIRSSFPGARLSWDFWSRLTASTELTSILVADWNLDNTEDVRLDVTQALPIAISSALAFKPSLRLLWRADPSLTEVTLVSPDGTPTGETVLVPLEHLDTFFTVALVVKL